MAIVEPGTRLDNIPLPNKDKRAIFEITWSAMTVKFIFLDIDRTSDFNYFSKMSNHWFWLDVTEDKIDMYFEDILMRQWQRGSKFIKCFMEDVEQIELPNHEDAWLERFYTNVIAYMD